MSRTSTILGLNVTVTSDGVRLDDGAAALLQDGVATVAIAQERLTRRKHAGGVGEAVHYCLQARGLTYADLDQVAVSICCDTSPSLDHVQAFLAEEGVLIDPSLITVVPSHHISHAASAFYPSGFAKALVIVADNEGNIIGERSHPDYWLNSLERTSVYVAMEGELTLLERFGDGPAEMSLGAAYNHFTKWLGFRSYHEAGTVMALAAHGSGRFDSVRVFGDEQDRFRCRLLAPFPSETSPDSTEFASAAVPDDYKVEVARLVHGEAVRRLVEKQTGIDVGDARTSCVTPDDVQADMAQLIQSELERVLVDIVRVAVRRTGIRKVCFAGGVAMNCVANAAIAALPEVDELYIQPASSDVGQALGNALWAYWSSVDHPRQWGMPTCSLGRSYGSPEIMEALDRFSDRLDMVQPDDLPAACAQLIADGAVIGWYDGGSEYGLRGLGRRSVLGDPRTMTTKRRLDQEIKLREVFRPYAPSVLEEELAEWFEIDDALRATAMQPMRCMLLAVSVRPDKRSIVPAVTFVDGSARIQAVSRGENERYHALLTRFHRLTGVPMVLNTSFNAGGDPVVETPLDAISSMLKMNLDALAIGDLLVVPN